MIVYDIQFTGPSDPQWYADRGLDISKDLWAGGKVVVYSSSAEPIEYDIEIMDGESWKKFSEYVITLEEHEYPWSKEQLLENFEKHTNHTIGWFGEHIYT